MRRLVLLGVFAFWLGVIGPGRAESLLLSNKPVVSSHGLSLARFVPPDVRTSARDPIVLFLLGRWTKPGEQGDDRRAQDLIGGSAPIVPAAFSSESPERKPEQEPPVWIPPLMTRRITQADRDAQMSPEFLDIILRVESMYDPTRLDGTGQIPRMSVRPGTASMNNVFADRWSIATTDENVDYRVRTIADAWVKHGVTACEAFGKRRFVYRAPVNGNLSLSDCNRLKLLFKDRDDLLTHLRIVAAVLNVPVFAAPLPGARLSSHDFWAAREQQIAIIKENLRLKREGGLSVGMTP